MANMLITSAAAYTSSDTFWLPKIGTAIALTPSLYRYQNAHYFVEVVGPNNFTYGPDGLPASGTYSAITLYSDSSYSVLIGSVFDFTANFAQLFSDLGASVLSGDDEYNCLSPNGGAFIGHGGADQITGSDGVDYFRYSSGSDAVSGETVLGRGGNDVIYLEDARAIDFTQVSLFSVETVSFAWGETDATFSGSQFGIGKITNVSGSGGIDRLSIDTVGSFNLSGITFTNWTSGEDTISIVGSGSADVMIGSTEGDTFQAREGNDTLDGGNGTDTAIYFGDRATFNIERIDGAGTTWRITDGDANNFGDDGSDLLTNIENFRFNAGDPTPVSLLVSDLIGAMSDTDGAADLVAENSSYGSFVGITAQATDGTGDTVTYSLTDGAGGRFAIDEITGVVFVAGAIDFETANSHNITVRATSADGSFTDKTFFIGVTNAGDAPVITFDVPSATINIAEGETVTINIVTNDPDGDMHGSAASGDDLAAFAIEGEGFTATNSGPHAYTLTFTAPDFENPADANLDNIYTITITDTDSFAFPGRRRLRLPSPMSTRLRQRWRSPRRSRRSQKTPRPSRISRSATSRLPTMRSERKR